MIDFSKLFHQSSKDLRQGGAVNIPSDSEKWPKEWKTIYYKAYPRFRKIPLLDTPPQKDFYELVRNRKSERDFTGRVIPLDALSTLLKYSCGITHMDEKKQSRAQASGGARFALEVYPLIFRGTADVPSGVYHYNVREHALDVLEEKEFSAETISELITYEFARTASMALIITAIFHRNQMKYGERGYRYMMLEAGHIGQNVYLNAAALGLKCCALGGTRDENIERLLGIDGITESVMYALVLG